MALLPQEASAAGNRGWDAGRAAGVAASPVSLDDNSSAVPRLSPKPGAAAVAPQEVKFVPEPRSFAPPRSERGAFAPEGAFALNKYHRRDEYQVRAHLFFLLLFLPPWAGRLPSGIARHTIPASRRRTKNTWSSAGVKHSDVCVRAPSRGRMRSRGVIRRGTTAAARTSSCTSCSARPTSTSPTSTRRASNACRFFTRLSNGVWAGGGRSRQRLSRRRRGTR